jgi:tubulysin polyketide synthase-like protein
MNAAELLAALRSQGVNLSVAGDRLHVDAPAGVISPALRNTLREQKAGLIALISTKPDPRPARPPMRRYHRHDRYWRRASHAAGYWVCGICHPPSDTEGVEWWG